MAHPIWHGVTVCPCIVSSAPLVERRFREAGLIAQDFGGLVSQGCYSAGAVTASKGTHDGGGVLDLDDWTPHRTDADVLFTDCAWIAFYRPKGILYPGSPAHWHVVVYGCPHLSDAAKAQIADAIKGLNGLKGKGKDDGPRPLKTWQQALADDAGTPPAPTQEDDMDLICIIYDDGPDPHDGQYASTAIISSATGWVRTSTGYGSRAELEAWKAIAGVLGMTITEKHVNGSGWIMSQRFVRSVPSAAPVDIPTLAKAVAAALPAATAPTIDYAAIAAAVRTKIIKED